MAKHKKKGYGKGVQNSQKSNGNGQRQTPASPASVPGTVTVVGGPASVSKESAAIVNVSSAAKSPALSSRDASNPGETSMPASPETEATKPVEDAVNGKSSTAGAAKPVTSPAANGRSSATTPTVTPAVVSPPLVNGGLKASPVSAPAVNRDKPAAKPAKASEPSHEKQSDKPTASTGTTKSNGISPSEQIQLPTDTGMSKDETVQPVDVVEKDTKTKGLDGKKKDKSEDQKEVAEKLEKENDKSLKTEVPSVNKPEPKNVGTVVNGNPKIEKPNDSTKDNTEKEDDKTRFQISQNGTTANGQAKEAEKTNVASVNTNGNTPVDNEQSIDESTGGIDNDTLDMSPEPAPPGDKSSAAPKSGTSTPFLVGGSCASCEKPTVRTCGGCVDAPIHVDAQHRAETVAETFYCSAECQRKDWRRHKVECQKLQARKQLQRGVGMLGDVRARVGSAALPRLVKGLFEGLSSEICKVRVEKKVPDGTDDKAFSIVYKVTLKGDGTTWAVDVDGASDNLQPWPEFLLQCRDTGQPQEEWDKTVDSRSCACELAAVQAIDKCIDKELAKTKGRKLSDLVKASSKDVEKFVDGLEKAVVDSHKTADESEKKEEEKKEEGMKELRKTEVPKENKKDVKTAPQNGDNKAATSQKAAPKKANGELETTTLAPSPVEKTLPAKETSTVDEKTDVQEKPKVKTSKKVNGLSPLPEPKPKKAKLVDEPEVVPREKLDSKPAEKPTERSRRDSGKEFDEEKEAHLEEIATEPETPEKKQLKEDRGKSGLDRKENKSVEKASEINGKLEDGPKITPNVEKTRVRIVQEANKMAVQSRVWDTPQKQKNEEDTEEGTEDAAPATAKDNAAFLAPTSTAEWYAIKNVSGKGFGVVAVKSIPKGTRILAEAPVFTVPREEHDKAAAERTVNRRVSRLGQDQKERFFALHNCHDRVESTGKAANLGETAYLGGCGRAMGITKTNALPLGVDDGLNTPEGGLFLEASRLNHSCSPNAHNTWNARMGKMTVHVARNVQPGEEICISYLARVDNYARRQARLKQAFGFDCTCGLCSLDRDARRESDAATDRLTELLDALSGARMHSTPLACLRDAREVVTLGGQACFGGGSATDTAGNNATFASSPIGGAYASAARLCIMHSDEARGHVFAQRAYDNYTTLEGEDGPTAEKLRSYKDRPSSHGLYGATRQWRQGMDKIPADLGKEGFDAWLWKDQ